MQNEIALQGPRRRTSQLWFSSICWSTKWCFERSLYSSSDFHEERVWRKELEGKGFSSSYGIFMVNKYTQISSLQLQNLGPEWSWSCVTLAHPLLQTCPCGMRWKWLGGYWEYLQFLWRVHIFTFWRFRSVKGQLATR